MNLVNMPITAKFAQALTDDAINGNYENKDAELGGVVMNVIKAVKDKVWFAAIRGEKVARHECYGLHDEYVNEIVKVLMEAGYTVTYTKEHNAKKNLMVDVFTIAW